MDRSVDSIGTCSLDVDASVEVSDHSEASSGGTLRSVNLSTPTPEPHLPSYLSLACTVNGYSTTINYDPDRLARSRDTSPHRPFSHDQLLNQNQDKHSKSLCDTIILDDSNSESGIKQSASSPSLPVLRHLRPEFRAQLPIMSPKKSADNSMQKSSTVPVLKDQVKVNGCSRVTEMNSKPVNGDASLKKINEIATLEESGEKNGHHFLKILQKETDRLLKLADEAEAELEDEELSEEVKGKLRSASGKARLLVSQKMQQFKGLCTNNINQVTGDQFPTTNEDLQGFWDMVMLQVDQVDTLFKEINCLKANNWQELKPQDSHVAKISTNGVSGKSKIKPRPRPTSAVNEEVRKQRELQRKQMLEDRRKAMRGQKKAQENVEIFVPESS